jgi:hypothetical protein
MSKDRPFRAIPIEHGRQFRKRRLIRKKQANIGKICSWFVLASLIGGGAGYLSLHAGDIGNATARLLPEGRSSAAPNNWVYFADCDAAREAGQAPIHVGKPGYRAELDADGDGTACEPYRGHRSHRRRMRFHF